ncbi:MAG: hypothetical protein V3S03_07150, partial [Vicinamibacteria bacterium]
HQLRVGLAGDRDGYYRDFTGSLEDTARTLADGWFFQGQHSEHFGGSRGTDPRAVPPRHFIVFLQNHDQIGNRAMGVRLHHQIDAAQWRAASVLLLLAPETPLLFMGQEWGASSPFQYFTDHDEGLGRLVAEGRRRELAAFTAFSGREAIERIPDPQAEATFGRSRLDWQERTREPHASLLRLYRALLSLRAELGLGRLERSDDRVSGRRGELVLEVARSGERRVLVVVRLSGTGALDSGRPDPEMSPELADRRGKDPPSTRSDLRHGLLGQGRWRVRLTTEEEEFTSDPQPPEVAALFPHPLVAFRRAGAAVLTLERPARAAGSRGQPAQSSRRGRLRSRGK